MTVSVSSASLFTIAWISGLIALLLFMQGVREGAPQVNVIDLDRLGESARENGPEGTAGTEGWDFSAPFVSPDGADEILRDYRRKQWMRALVALAGFATSFGVTQRLWRQLPLSFNCLLTGPVGFMRAAMEE